MQLKHKIAKIALKDKGLQEGSFFELDLDCALLWVKPLVENDSMLREVYLVVVVSPLKQAAPVE